MYHLTQDIFWTNMARAGFNNAVEMNGGFNNV
jgi:hypothetical protein